MRLRNGGYFLTADDAEGLVLRPDSTTDDATPNPNGVAAQNLLRLAVLAGDDDWRARADRLFDGLLPLAAGNLFGHTALLNALDMRLRAAEIVVTGAGERAAELAARRAAASVRRAHRAARADRRGAAALASRARQGRRRARGRRLHLRRRALLAAGDGAGEGGGGGQGDEGVIGSRA